MAFDKRKSYRNALTFTQQGRWDKAIAEYQAILKADPRDLTACNNLGDLYARVGKVTEAIEQYLKLGELFRADGLTVKAIAVYKKVVKLSPTRIDALLACADLYEEQGLTGEARIQLTTVAEHYGRAGNTGKLIEVYQRLAQLDPTNHVLIAKLGDLLVREGKPEAAAAEYELAAQVAEAAGHPGESKRLLKKVSELRPISPAASLALAEAHLREGRHAEAIEALITVTRVDSRSVEAWRLLGEAYANTGQDQEGIAALEKAVSLGLPETAVRRPLASALMRAGRTEEGTSLCRRAAEEAIRRGEPDEAIADCQAILAIAPHLTSLHAYLVGLLKRMGLHEEAQAATWTLAAAHEAAGETEAAIQVYDQLLEQDPSDERARARLKMLEGAPAIPVALQEEVPTGLLIDSASGGPAPTVFDSAPEDPALVAQDSAPLDLAPTAGESTSGEPAPMPAELPPTEVVPLELSPLEPPTVDIAPPDRLPVSEEEAPALVLDVVPPEEPPTPNLTLSPKDTASFLGEPSLVRGEESETGPRFWRVFELDDAGEIAGIRQATHDPSGGSLDRWTGLVEPRELFPEETQSDAQAELQALAKAEAPGEGAEQLAEAEVYLKYGLTEKARDRLLEVVRLAPENVTAHLRLKDLYLERSQAQAACREIVAAARILERRAHWNEALTLVRQGLSLLPHHQELQGLAARLSGGAAAPAEARPAVAPAETGGTTKQAPEVWEELGLPQEPPFLDEDIVPFELDPVLEELPGLDQVPVDQPEGLGTAPLEVTPPDVTPPGVAPAEAGPTVAEPPTAGGWATEPLQDLETALEEPSLPGGPEWTLVEEDLPPDLLALLEDPEVDAGPAPLADESEGSVDQALDQGMTDDLAEAEFYFSQGMAEEARAVLRRMQARAPDHPAVARLTHTLLTPSVEAVPVVSETPLEFVEPSVESLEGPPTAAQTPGRPVPLEPAALDGGEPPPSAGLQEAAPRPVDPLSPPEPSGQPQGWEAAPLTPEPVSPPVQGMSVDQVVPTFSVQDSRARPDEGGFVNLGAELEEELAAEDRAAAAGGPLVQDLLKEFQRGVREHIDEKDFETHYNLGIAYKEMLLYDEAIQAFRLAGKDPGRILTCMDLIGLCYLAKGETEAAIRQLREGLEVRGHSRDAYHALRYDLGTAYETQGDLKRALEAFESVMAEDEKFRDVRSRVTDLRDRVGRQGAPTQAQVPPPPGKGQRNKISFI